MSLTRLSKCGRAHSSDVSRTSTRRITGRFKIGHRVSLVVHELTLPNYESHRHFCGGLLQLINGKNNIAMFDKFIL